MGTWTHADEHGNKGPHVPVIVHTEESVKLFGRGGADYGYSTFATMIAIKALQEQGVHHPSKVYIT